MIRSVVLVLGAATVLCAGVAPGVSAQEPDTRPAVAVFPFTKSLLGSNPSDFEGLEGGLQQMLLTELRQNSNLRLVERAQLAAIMEEQNLGASGRVDPATAVELGRIANARYAVLGVYVDNFGDVRMDAQVIDTETTELLRAAQVRAPREELYQSLVDLSSQVLAELDLPPLPAEMREARRSREIPTEAVTLYSRAQLYADGGQTDRAIQLYRQISEQFPDLTEAREALRQLEG